MDPTLLKIASPNQVLLNILWTERKDQPSAYSNDKLQPLLNLLKRSNYNYDKTYSAVKDWISTNLKCEPTEETENLEQTEDDAYYWLWYNVDACLIYEGKSGLDHTIPGMLRIGISMEPEDTEIDITFVTPMFLKTQVMNFTTVRNLKSENIQIQLSNGHFLFRV